MKFRILFAVLAGLAMPALGCTERVTNDDVEAARKKAEREQQEAYNVRGQSPDKQIEENSEARKAAAELAETKAKADATKDRDLYVSAVEAKLTAANQKIDALQNDAKSQSGATKDATDKRIADIKDRRDRVKDGLSTLKSAELLKWGLQKENVDKLITELNGLLT